MDSGIRRYDGSLQAPAMQYLFVSDLHYVLKQFDWIDAVAERVDLLIIGGDLLDIAATVGAGVQIVVMLEYLKRLQAKTQVLVCSGNHDLDASNADGEKYARWIHKAERLGVKVDGGSFEYHGRLFTVCPWWDGPKSRIDVGRQLARDASKEKQQWVWIYHSPPANSPTCWVGKRHIGDDALSEWIDDYTPDQVFTGHIHQSPFVREGSWVDRIGATWVFNPGRQIGPEPTRILVDTDKKTATWVSLAGAETVELDRPLYRPVAEASELPDWIR
jgi:Icc-related predicted phosphoesterase